MKNTMPLLGVATLGMALAWVANARFDDPAQPAKPHSQLQSESGESAPAQLAQVESAPTAIPVGKTAGKKTAPRKSTKSAKPVQWRRSLQAAFAESKRTGKPIMVDFYADWCGPCKILDKAYEQPNLVAESRKWIPVKIDVDQDPAAMETYKANRLPTIVFFNARGKETGRKVGFSVPRSVNDMDGLVKHLAQDVTKTMRAERKKKNAA